MDIPTIDFLLSPSTPFFVGALALVCLATMLLLQLEWQAQAVASLPSLLTRWGFARASRSGTLPPYRSRGCCCW